jgi:hypothetical protein
MPRTSPIQGWFSASFERVRAEEVCAELCSCPRSGVLRKCNVHSQVQGGWARRDPVTHRELPHWARERSGILRRPCCSGFAADQARHPIQDQIKAKLEVVLKIGLRIGWRRLKDPGTYRSSQHWKSALVNQPSKELTVWQR